MKTNPSFNNATAPWSRPLLLKRNTDVDSVQQGTYIDVNACMHCRNDATRGHHGYALIEPPPHPTYDLYKVIDDALAEDAGDLGDITTLSTYVCVCCDVYYYYSHALLN